MIESLCLNNLYDTIWSTDHIVCNQFKFGWNIFIGHNIKKWCQYDLDRPTKTAEVFCDLLLRRRDQSKFLKFIQCVTNKVWISFKNRSYTPNSTQLYYGSIHYLIGKISMHRTYELHLSIQHNIFKVPLVFCKWNILLS